MTPLERLAFETLSDIETEPGVRCTVVFAEPDPPLTKMPPLPDFVRLGALAVRARSVVGVGDIVAYSFGRPLKTAERAAVEAVFNNAHSPTWIEHDHPRST